MFIWQGSKRKVHSRKRGNRAKAARKAKNRRRVNNMLGRKIGRRVNHPKRRR
jgi:hypothetical protein